MTKKQLLTSIFLVLILWACHVNEPMPSWHYIITMETDLPKIVLNCETVLDSNTVYPYTLYDAEEGSTTFSILTYFCPISDTGYILFRMYGDWGYDKLSPTLKDTLKITTPITDTIRIIFRGFNQDTIYVKQKIKRITDK